jgi:hypothetical protein
MSDEYDNVSKIKTRGYNGYFPHDVICLFLSIKTYNKLGISKCSKHIDYWKSSSIRYASCKNKDLIEDGDCY